MVLPTISLVIFISACNGKGMEVSVFDLADAGIPFFDVTLLHTPITAEYQKKFDLMIRLLTEEAHLLTR